MLLRRELSSMLKLAGPVVLAEIGWMSMGIVDTIMVGPLGPAAIGAAGIASGIFTALAIFGMGLMLGLDALVSQSYGAHRLDECVRWLQHGVLLSVASALPLMLIGYGLVATVDAWGLNPDIRRMAEPYMRILFIGTLPLLLYAAARRYLQGIHCVKPVMVALVTANLVNAGGNWLLIYGHFGLPALGTDGSAWSTGLSRIYMAAFLLLAIAREHRRRGDAHPHVPWRLEAGRVRRLFALGFPAASQVTLEVGVFAAVTALAGKLDAVSSASHQIALNIAALAFMVPLGLSSAGAVRVGHAVGGRDAEGAARAGWTALATGACFMLMIGVALFTVPVPMVQAFTRDAQVIRNAVGLLAIAAAFQLFDGTQAVATGVLRGLGDTRTPMIMNIIGHWVLGLPIGYVLCFWFGWGVRGLWVGLSIGLIFVAIVLTIAWDQKVKSQKTRIADTVAGSLNVPNVTPERTFDA
jgi:MATE family multidrug resistance protein